MHEMNATVVSYAQNGRQDHQIVEIQLHVEDLHDAQHPEYAHDQRNRRKRTPLERPEYREHEGDDDQESDSYNFV